MVHLKKFNDISEYNTGKNDLLKPSFSYIEEDGDTIYDKKVDEKYLIFQAITNGMIGWKSGGVEGVRTIQYSRDFGGTWVDWTSTVIEDDEDLGTTINVSVGDIIYVKGNNSGYYDYADTGYSSWFASTADFYAYGDVCALLGENDMDPYALSYLFAGCVNLYSHPMKKLKLSATTLANHCYSDMFSDCTSLTIAPELPATTLVSGCYSDMFLDCPGLTTAPELPATTLVSSCYSSMFAGCASLTTAPELPATTLVSDCYSSMFLSCSSLTTAPALPATTLAEGCYQYMFQGCTSLTTAPALPATTLATGCYNGMFRNCTSLNKITAIFTTTPSDTYTSNWVDGVAATGTFTGTSNWGTGTDKIPSGWTVNIL